MRFRFWTKVGLRYHANVYILFLSDGFIFSFSSHFFFYKDVPLLCHFKNKYIIKYELFPWLSNRSVLLSKWNWPISFLPLWKVVRGASEAPNINAKECYIILFYLKKTGQNLAKAWHKIRFHEHVLSISGPNCLLLNNDMVSDWPELFLISGNPFERLQVQANSSAKQKYWVQMNFLHRLRLAFVNDSPSFKSTHYI